MPRPPTHPRKRFSNRHLDLIFYFSQFFINAEGYAASPVYVDVDANGGDAGIIVLTKASVLQGTVKRPAAITTSTHIDVQAINTEDTDDRYWGWGDIDPSQNGGLADTGTIQIDGIPAGIYNLDVRVMGYKIRPIPPPSWKLFRARTKPLVRWPSKRAARFPAL